MPRMLQYVIFTIATTNAFSMDIQQRRVSFVSPTNITTINKTTPLHKRSKSLDVSQRKILMHPLSRASTTLDLNQTTTPTPLMLAAVMNNQSDTTTILTSKNNYAYINAHDKNGTTALMVAADNNAFLVVPLLLEQREIKINAWNNNGWTALMFAIYNRHRESAALLLNDQRTDVTIQNKKGETAYSLAMQRKLSTIASWIQFKTQSTSPKSEPRSV